VVLLLAAVYAARELLTAGADPNEQRDDDLSKS
jgi:hypothetical protein